MITKHFPLLVAIPLLCNNFYHNQRIIPSCDAFSPKGLMTPPPTVASPPASKRGSIFSFSSQHSMAPNAAGQQHYVRQHAHASTTMAMSLFGQSQNTDGAFGEKPVNGDHSTKAAAVDDYEPPALAKGRSDEEVFQFIEDASEAQNLYYLDTVIIGAGPAGIGVAHSLLRGGMNPSSILLIEKERSIGSSFREWHNTTKFISPSWAGYPFGVQDLNAVVPDTTVCSGETASQQHPTGNEYASYLERMMNGTNLSCLFGERVISIERRAKQGCFIIQSRNDRKRDLGDCVFIANYVVWAGGEWNSPRLPSSSDTEEEEVFAKKDATVHYKHANVETLLQSRRSDDDRIVLIGGGEAGADLGVALANRGAKVMIVEESCDDGEVLDPSRKLSPVTTERLANAGENIDFRTGVKCTKVHREGDTVTITLDCGLKTSAEGDTRTSFPKSTTETVTTGADAVLCTGFDPSSNPLLKDMFEWNKEGLPVVTPENDESTITKNLFLAGPSLMHQLACNDDEKSENGNDDDDDDSKNIIFCFVYKYRTRFAVVASAIIQRYMEDQQLKLQALYDTPVEEMDDENVQSDVMSADEIAELLVKKKNMQAYYRSKGFLITDLSCAQLACGMTGNDAPQYDNDSSCCAPSENGKEAECQTCTDSKNTQRLPPLKSDAPQHDNDSSCCAPGENGKEADCQTCTGSKNTQRLPLLKSLGYMWYNFVYSTGR